LRIGDFKTIMFVYDWLKSTVSDLLSYLGLLPENSKILFLGLDNAGKTTLLYMLRDDRITTHNPTLHPHAEELTIGNRRFRAFDLGGHEVARRIWKDYYADVDAVIFLVDASDRSRMDEAKNELHGLFNTESLRQIPFAILGNKIDIPTACSSDELRHYLQITTNYSYGGYGGDAGNSAVGPNGGPVEIFMVSLVNKMGYGQAFTWISDVLKNQKKNEG